METVQLEFWSDSFHEGFWACDHLSDFFELVKVDYLQNFIPVFTFRIHSKLYLEIIIYGSYKSWEPIPNEIEYLLNFGKPDLIILDPLKEKILLSVEETSAVPTGNQALQRCERMFGSLRKQIPFWYLIGEFGIHIDGGVRRDSIWPSILAIKLSGIYKTPCVVLHYADEQNPEDYSVGQGVKALFSTIATSIKIYFKLTHPEELRSLLIPQYGHMLKFILSQCDEIVDHLPNKELLSEPGLPDKISKRVMNIGNMDWPSKLFEWGKTSELPTKLRTGSTAGFIKYDKFITYLESIVEQKHGYNLSSNAGSKPQPEDRMLSWISEQNTIYSRVNKEYKFTLKDFPESTGGNYHVTTAKNIIYLIDHWKFLQSALNECFEYPEPLFLTFNDPVLLYISNSIKPGRLFGDPYTGQISAFANIFAKNFNGETTRKVVAYFPHQVYPQLFNEKGFKRNKGIAIMRELLDYAIFYDGVIVNMKNGEIKC